MMGFSSSFSLMNFQNMFYLIYSSCCSFLLYAESRLVLVELSLRTPFLELFLTILRCLACSFCWSSFSCESTSNLTLVQILIPLKSPFKMIDLISQFVYFILVFSYIFFIRHNLCSSKHFFSILSISYAPIDGQIPSFSVQLFARNALFWMFCSSVYRNISFILSSKYLYLQDPRDSQYQKPKEYICNRLQTLYSIGYMLSFTSIQRSRRISANLLGNFSSL